MSTYPDPPMIAEHHCSEDFDDHYMALVEIEDNDRVAHYGRCEQCGRKVVLQYGRSRFAHAGAPVWKWLEGGM